MPDSVTQTGNVTRDPELRFTPSGQATATFGLAVNRRFKNGKDEWEEQTSFFNVVVWNEQAENVSESVHKGDRVVVTGRIEQRSWEKDGQKHSTVEIIADELGPSLRWATAQIQRTERRNTAAPNEDQPAPRASRRKYSSAGARKCGCSCRRRRGAVLTRRLLHIEIDLMVESPEQDEVVARAIANYAEQAFRLENEKAVHAVTLTRQYSTRHDGSLI